MRSADEGSPKQSGRLSISTDCVVALLFNRKINGARAGDFERSKTRQNKKRVAGSDPSRTRKAPVSSLTKNESVQKIAMPATFEPASAGDPKLTGHAK
jgi:hypothetical protein